MTDVSDFPSVAAMVIFCLCIVVTIALVFKTVFIRVPLPGGRALRMRAAYYAVPPCAVLAMLACTSMSIRDVGRGLLGNDQIQPYGILVLFMSMAYIAGSLDATGVFAWLALKFTYMSGGRGRVLFLFYFLLSSFITTFTSNDVCILTLTPIVCYFAAATGVDPLPFLYAEYAAANTFGALLYTGNPTNIIVADAYDMTFLGYSKYMTLPTLAGGVACFGVLLLQFRHQVPVLIPLPTVDATHMLRDRLGAVVGSVNMLTCLGLLAAAPSLGWDMWAITLVCAGIHASYNAWAFRGTLLRLPFGSKAAEEASVSKTAAAGAGRGQAAAEAEAVAAGRETGAKEAGQVDPSRGTSVEKVELPSPPTLADGIQAGASGAAGREQVMQGRGGEGGCDGGSPVRRVPRLSTQGVACGAKEEGHGAVAATISASSRLSSSSVTAATRPESCVALQTAPYAEAVIAADAAAHAAAPKAAVAMGLAAGAGAAAPPAMTVDSLRGACPTFWTLLYDLPWEVVPFALGMFVLVEGLYVQGWLEVFGSGLGSASTSLPGAVWVMGVLSVALANTVNNQPMTILLTRVALDQRFVARVNSSSRHRAALFALVLGSNIGAVFTLIGALAGILWSTIAAQRGVAVSYGSFARICCPVGAATLAASLAVLWAEFAVFPPQEAAR